MPATVQQRIASTLCLEEAGVISRRSDRAALYPRGYPPGVPYGEFSGCCPNRTSSTASG